MSGHTATANFRDAVDISAVKIPLTVINGVHQWSYQADGKFQKNLSTVLRDTCRRKPESIEMVR